MKHYENEEILEKKGINTNSVPFMSLATHLALNNIH